MKKLTHYFEVVERKTGALMSASRPPELMGTTTFETRAEAETWMKKVDLTEATHFIKETELS